MVKIPVGILQILEVLRFRRQAPGWATSSVVDSWSRPRLGYHKFGGFGIKIPDDISQVLWLSCFDFASFVISWSGSRLGYLKICDFVVKTSIGICYGQDPGWDKSRFETSWSRSRLG